MSDRRRGRDEQEPSSTLDPIPSYELPKRQPGRRWQRRRIDEQMEERSAEGWDTPMNRREFLDVARKLGTGVAASSFLYPAFLAACGKTADQLTPQQGGRFNVDEAGGGEAINIGVISIYSGVGAFVGKLADRGGQLAVEQINKHGLPAKGLQSAKNGFPDFEAYERQTNGGILGGRKIRLIARDDNLSAQVAVSALQEMITRFDIKGVIFAGLYDDIYAAKKLLQQYNLPAIAAYGDLASVGQLYPKNDYRQLFQMFPPDQWGIEVMINEYLLADRGYTKFAYLGDNTAIGAQGKRLIGETLAKTGKRLLAAEQYNVGDVDMTAQLQRIKGTGCNALMVWGIAGDTAHALESVKRLDAVYIDRDRAKGGGGWHPQIVGFEGGAAERTFAVLAGDAARTGTMSYWYLGGIGYIPQFKDAVDTFKKRWGVAPTGGENNPADAVFLFARAFEQAGGTDSNKVIAALENLEGGGINFSSITPHFFTKDRHISIEPADMVGITLERGKAVSTSPAYELGAEFIGNPKADPPVPAFNPPGYVGPTHFMRFNQEALMKKHAKLFGDVMMKNGFGTQCTKKADSSAPYGFRLTNDCKIH